MPLIDHITKYIPENVESSLGFYAWPVLILGILTWVLLSNNFFQQQTTTKSKPSHDATSNDPTERPPRPSRVITPETPQTSASSSSRQRPIISFVDSVSQARARSELVSGNFDVPDRDDDEHRSVERSQIRNSQVVSSRAPAPNTSAAVIAQQDQEFAAAQHTDLSRAASPRPASSDPASAHWRGVQTALDSARQQERIQADAERARKLAERQAESDALARRQSVVSSLRDSLRAGLRADEGGHRVCVRLPDGNKATRSFPGDALVADVRAWASSLDCDATVRWSEGAAEPVLDAFTLVRPGARGAVGDGEFVADLGRMVVLFVEMVETGRASESS